VDLRAHGAVEDDDTVTQEVEKVPHPIDSDRDREFRRGPSSVSGPLRL
jgi:hypothetical protein